MVTVPRGWCAQVGLAQAVQGTVQVLLACRHCHSFIRRRIIGRGGGGSMGWLCNRSPGAPNIALHGRCDGHALAVVCWG